MQEGKRPGGLTALAVINFVGAGIDVLKVLGLIATMMLAGKMAETIEREARERVEGADGKPAASEPTDEEREAIAALRGFDRVGRPAYYAWLALVVACGGLLVAGGVGYLGQRRWARAVATLYALVSMGTTCYAMVIIPSESGGGFRFATLLNFLYPILTLALVHTSFREDLRQG
jgi:hypothetical protein